MKKSYTSSYLKIYFWQGAAFLFRFISLFIVTPYLTKEPSIYGIYAVCISVTIYLNYADLGFLRAGQKFAAESFARGERLEEMKYIGFGTFVLLIFTIVCDFVFLYFGLHPQHLIKGLDSDLQIATASKLLLILAVFTPITVFQRMIMMIFEIRLDSYKYQRITLCSSIIIIGSVLYFFHSGTYRIVDYFLFSQVINLLVVIFCSLLAIKMYTYDFKHLFRCLRFDLDVFNKMKYLAFSGLYLMIIWILFYELDTIVIGKFLGVQKVAIYAIAWTFATLFRWIYSIIFSPFAVRVNYFIGNNDDEGLKKYCFQLVSLSAPIIIIPTVAFALIAKPFILTWVGVKFMESIPVARLFSLLFTLSFISYSTSMFLVAKVKNKEMSIIATIQPIIFWVGILCTYSYWGLISFAFFKLIAIVFSNVCFLYLLTGLIGVSWQKIIKKAIFPVLLPLLFLIISITVANRFYILEKSKLNLLIVLGTTGCCIFLSLLIQYFTNTDIRLIVKNIVRNMTPKTTV